MESELENEQVILSGDIISFCMDNVGYLAIPSMLEPIPENEEIVTHLRCTGSTDVINLDFTRSMFRIELDGVQVISMFRLNFTSLPFLLRKHLLNMDPL